MHEFGRRRDLCEAPDRPVSVVEIELRHDIGEVHIGGPISIERAYIAPIVRGLSLGAHTRAREVMRDGAAVTHDKGDDVLAEVAARIGISRIAPKLIE